MELFYSREGSEEAIIIFTLLISVFLFLFPDCKPTCKVIKFFVYFLR